MSDQNETTGEEITQEQMEAEIAAAQEAIDADEIAQRVRKLGMGIVSMIASADKKAGKTETRSQGDAAIQVMEGSLDLLYVALQDVRKMRKAQERMADAVEKQTAILKNEFAPMHVVVGDDKALKKAMAKSAKTKGGEITRVDKGDTDS